MALKLVRYRMLWTHIAERESMSTSSAILMIPFVRSIWMLQKEWTVRPKWCPWWTRGSCTNLKHQPNMVRPTKKMQKEYIHFFLWSKLQSVRIGPLLWSRSFLGGRSGLVSRVAHHRNTWSDSVLAGSSQNEAYLYLLYDIVLRKFCCNEASVDEPICKT